jgi:tetratricopeptide (TPR) repeat protein
LHALRHRPLLAIGFVVFLCAGGGLVGGYLWVESEFRAAERAFHAEQYEEAERHIQSCLRFWPRSAATHFLACRIERFRMNFDKAADHLAKAERLHGVTEATQTEWVLLRAQRGEIDEVAPALWNCIARNHPETPLIFATLAKTYLRQLRFASALAVLERWLKFDPNCVRALDWRGWVRERLDQPSRAVLDYERALELEPERFEVRRRLLSLLLDGERYTEARQHLKVLGRDHPDLAETLTAEARCSLAQGKVARARQFLARAVERQPEDVTALYWRGQVELEAGNAAEAERWLRRLLKVDAAHVPGHYSLSLVLVRLQRPAAEIQAEKDILARIAADCHRLKELAGRQPERSPPDPVSTSEVGEIFLRLGRQREGVEWLHRALNLNPNCLRAHTALIKHYQATGQPAKAAEHRRYLSEHGLTTIGPLPNPDGLKGRSATRHE